MCSRSTRGRAAASCCNCWNAAARAAQKVEELKAGGHIDSSLNPDIVRMAFVSLAMTPMLLKDIFEDQMGGIMDEVFLNELAVFNGRLIAAGLAAQSHKAVRPEQAA